MVSGGWWWWWGGLFGGVLDPSVHRPHVQVEAELKNVTNISKAKVFLKLVFSDNVDIAKMNLSDPKFAGNIAKDSSYDGAATISKFLFMQLDPERVRIKLAEFDIDACRLGVGITLWRILQSFGGDAPALDDMLGNTNRIDDIKSQINSYQTQLQNASPSNPHLKAFPRLYEIGEQLTRRLADLAASVTDEMLASIKKASAVARKHLDTPELLDYVNDVKKAEVLTKDVLKNIDTLVRENRPDHKMSILDIDATRRIKNLSVMCFPHFLARK